MAWGSPVWLAGLWRGALAASPPCLALLLPQLRPLPYLMPHLEQGEAFSFPKESAVECCSNGDPDHSCHVGGCAGDPLLWYHAMLQSPTLPEQSLQGGGWDSWPCAAIWAASAPQCCQPLRGLISLSCAASQQPCLPTHPYIYPFTLPGHPCPVAHLSVAPGSPMSYHGPSSPFCSPVPLPSSVSAHTVFLPADDADGHFHECHRHQRCGAR